MPTEIKLVLITMMIVIIVLFFMFESPPVISIGNFNVSFPIFIRAINFHCCDPHRCDLHFDIYGFYTYRDPFSDFHYGLNCLYLYFDIYIKIISQK